MNVKLFAVHLVDDDQPITYFETKAKCIEYIYSYICAENIEHYVSWCEVRNLPTADPKSKESYVTVTSEEQLKHYKILKIKVSPSNIAKLFRIEARSLPLLPEQIQSFEYPEFMRNTLADMLLTEHDQQEQEKQKEGV